MRVIEYLLKEVKQGRLPKTTALDLLEELDGKSSEASCSHPLLQKNCSEVGSQRFVSQLDGQEIFLSGHRVGGRPVLPAVAYLEMVHAAMQASVPSTQRANRMLVVKNTMWVRPLTVEEPRWAEIVLSPQGSGALEVEICSAAGLETLDDVSSESVLLHAQCEAEWAEAKAAPRHEVSALQRGCKQSLSGSQCYELFERLGFGYGGAHRGIEQVQSGEDASGRYVLARIELHGAQEPYALHPGMLDSALQAAVGLALSEQGLGELQPTLPFALERLEVYRATPARGWVYLRASAPSGREKGLQRLDIDVCDESGEVCVRLQGLNARAVQSESATLLVQRQWRAAPSSGTKASFGEHWVLLDGRYESHLEALQRRLPQVKCIVLPQSADLSEQSQLNAVSVLEQLQQIVQSRPTAAVRVQVLLSESDVGGMGLAGMLKSAAQENAKLQGQVIVLSAREQAEGLVRAVQENAGEQVVEVRYVNGERQILEHEELNATALALPWREGGVYLITGGAGGLGRIFAEQIMEQVHRAKLVLVGRRALDASERAQLERLARRDGSIEYRAVDVTDEAAVEALVQEIRTRHGALHGVIHAAGTIEDNFLVKKTPAQLRAVAGSKIRGVAHLDRATAQDRLDCFIVFASLAGVLGNAGQSDYAFANAFLDEYAQWRARRVECGERYGKTLSIGWPLWSDGGMQVNAAVMQQMRGLGLHALSSSDAMQALYLSYGLTSAQVAVLHGDAAALRTLVHAANANAAAPSSQAPAPRPSASSRSDLLDRASHYLKELLGATLKMPAERIDVNAGLEKYGIDSLMALQMVNALEQVFGSLSKMLFYEYQSIAELARYFVGDHEAALLQLLGPESEVQPRQEAPPSAPPRVESAVFQRLRHRKREPLAAQPAHSTEQSRNAGPYDVAIIGLSGRYPQARTVQQFWDNLKAGRDCITEIPEQRWDHSIYFDPKRGALGKSYSKWGGFIDGVDEFDPAFFNISPREAQVVDPQERLFLQCVYETLEDSGYTREALSSTGNVGVFVGVMYEEYQLLGAQTQRSAQPFALAGCAASIANRVSYFGNFHGPSIALDTMCSSSLSAIHLACQSLLQGECTVAIAGGVNVSIHPNKYLLLAQGQFMSSKGRCESFGAGGDGYVPGEGVGAVLLKPLAQAIADGDHIYGVIKASSLNHGGKTNGYTVPNPNAQAQVIERALRTAQVPARAISYIEAHGTGTSLGDPIEITGLSKVFGAQTKDVQFCAIGSAKSNIGHCESAAGIAGLTKVLLQMQHATLVPSLHAEQLNPHVDFERSAFFVQRELSEWRRPQMLEAGRSIEYPRTAGISSFGAGGSNAHLIVQEYIADVPAAALKPAHPAIIVLSARTEEQLRERARALLARSSELTDAELPRVAFTLQVGRDHFQHRLAFTTDSLNDFQRKLTLYLDDAPLDGLVFTGQTGMSNAVTQLLEEEAQASLLVRNALSKGKYAQLLTAWVQGLSIDWSLVGDPATARRVSLPTYPFARVSCWATWLESPAETSSTRGALDAHPKRERISDQDASRCRFYAPIWVSRPTPHSIAPKDEGCWLLFAGDEPLDHAIAAELQGQGARIVRVRIGSEFTATSDGYTVNAAHPEQLRRLAKILADANVRIARIIHSWTLTPVGALLDFDNDQERGALALIHWMQAQAAVAQESPCSIVVVTNGLQVVNGTENCSVAKAGLPALCRVLSQEYAHVRAHVVDVLAHTDADMPALARATIAEALGSESGEVAYRGRRRFVQRFEEFDAGTLERRRGIRAEGVYLITGGLGNLGLALARHLTRFGRPRLVLTSRATFPARETWASVVAQSPTSPAAATIERLREIERLGAEVTVARVDVASEASVTALVRSVADRYGAIHGVFHLAGALKHRSIYRSVAELTGDDWQAQLEPKALGAIALRSALGSLSPDFVCLFSSNSSVLGGFGFAAYAAANGFLDHFARQAGLEGGTAWIAVNTDGWILDAADGNTNSYAAKDPHAVTTTAGFDVVLDAISTAVEPQIVVSTADLSKRIDAWLAPRERSSPNVAATPSPQSTERSTAEPPRNDLERQMLSIWEQTLGISGIGVHDDFLEMGGNSMLGMRIIARLSDAFGVTLPVSAIIDSSPTVASLSVQLVTQLAAEAEADVFSEPQSAALPA